MENEGFPSRSVARDNGSANSRTGDATRAAPHLSVQSEGNSPECTKEQRLTEHLDETLGSLEEGDGVDSLLRGHVDVALFGGRVSSEHTELEQTRLTFCTVSK